MKEQDEFMFNLDGLIDGNYIKIETDSTGNINALMYLKQCQDRIKYLESKRNISKDYLCQEANEVSKAFPEAGEYINKFLLECGVRRR